jgi:hypothetical protein
MVGWLARTKKQKESMSHGVFGKHRQLLARLNSWRGCGILINDSTIRTTVLANGDAPDSDEDDNIFDDGLSTDRDGMRLVEGAKRIKTKIK